MKKIHPQKTYVQLHNKTLENYRRCSRFILWIAVLNSIGVLLTMFYNQFAFASCLESNYLLFRLLDKTNFPSNEIFFFSCLGITLVLIIPFALLYMKAHQGKSWPLYTTLIIYFIDLILLFIFNNYQNLGEDFFFRLGIHLVVITFLMMAIFNYHALIVLAKRYRSGQKSESRDK